MGKLCEGSVLEAFQPISPPNPTSWTHSSPYSGHFSSQKPEISGQDWDLVSGLQTQQRLALRKLGSHGVRWRHPTKPTSELFFLFHGGEVETDGNCLFSASKKALGIDRSEIELRKRVVERFREDYDAGLWPKDKTDQSIKNMYRPDLDQGWGIHFVQEIKLLALKKDRNKLEKSIQDLVQVGLSREAAAETVYRERCVNVENGESWAKYMCISGSSEDEYDIISIHYTQDGLLTIDENKDGRAAAFGDDIAIEALATEFKREIFVVQAHGSDGLSDEEGCMFFLPHKPKGLVTEPPIFLLMRGTGWCGAGADHYEPLITCAAVSTAAASPEKAAVFL